MRLKPGLRLASYKSGVDLRSPLRILIGLAVFLASLVSVAAICIYLLLPSWLTSIAVTVGFVFAISIAFRVNTALFKQRLAVILQVGKDGQLLVRVPERPRHADSTYRDVEIANKGIQLVGKTSGALTIRDAELQTHNLPISYRRCSEQRPLAVGRQLDFLDLTVSEGTARTHSPKARWVKACPNAGY